MSPEERTNAEVPRFPRSRDDVVFRELADEWVLFDPETRRLHVLNLTAAVVWSHCSGEHEVEEIVRRVRGAFEEPPALDEVRKDVEEALGTFAREALLAASGTSAGGR